MSSVSVGIKWCLEGAGGKVEDAVDVAIGAVYSRDNIAFKIETRK